MNCDTARIYCGAVADDELALVPAAVLTHVHACHECSIEVQWQRHANQAIASALSVELEERAPAVLPPVLRPPRWRQSRVFIGIAAAAAVLVAVGTLSLGHGYRSATQRPGADLAISDAAHAYGRPAGFSSNDTAAISGWAEGRGLPVEVMTMPDAVPTGARVSTIEGHPMVTVIYTGSAGTTEVTAIPASMATTWPAMEINRVDRRPAGWVHRGASGVIVVTPDERALHVAMAALQAA
ncbi:MAG: hypothetical protein NVSMB17_07910 [Candidatus Dormibacteria bacterium]